MGNFDSLSYQNTETSIIVCSKYSTCFLLSPIIIIQLLVIGEGKASKLCHYHHCTQLNKIWQTNTTNPPSLQPSPQPKLNATPLLRGSNFSYKMFPFGNRKYALDPVTLPFLSEKMLWQFSGYPKGYLCNHKTHPLSPLPKQFI